MASLLPFHTRGITEAGCDEAGRGCLAGPVVAAAVILPEGWNHPILNDSKQLNHRQRDVLRAVLEAEALHWAVGVVLPAEIDRINILRASFLAMHKALDQLPAAPQSIIVDGNRFVPYREIPHHCIIKGDGKYRHIAAASVLAKTHRDEIMDRLHAESPHYGWSQNKGYPTPAHRKAIAIYGPGSHHRMSFTLLPAQEISELEV
jgi:ribonuclease HII